MPTADPTPTDPTSADPPSRPDPGSAPQHAPYVPPACEAPSRDIVDLRIGAPFHWLRLGWQDLRAAKAIGLFYGTCFWLMALVLGAVFQHRPEYAMSMASGCLLVGPFLAMGLYEASRRREQGQAPELAGSLTCWDKHLSSMGLLVMVLIVLELLWGRASLVVFAVFFNTGMPSTTGVLQALLDERNREFLAVYLLVGGAFATLVFGVSVVSIPMILDRDTDAISAAITSLQVVLHNAAVMFLWAALITGLVVLSLLYGSWGLLIIGPWLGHASWHAYRGSVRWRPADHGTLNPST